jgi:hypothetical protein
MEKEERTTERTPSRPRQVVEQSTLRPTRQIAGPLEIVSPTIDLSPLVALTIQRRMIASMPLKFQDSWHRPREINFFGAELAEAYEAYRDDPTVRIARLVDLINQNLLLSAALVFAAVILSVISTSPSMRQRCTTVVCVLERQIASIQPRMGYARLLLRIFLLVFSLGIFFWLTTAYAYAATTVPLRHIYNGRLLNSSGNPITTSHAIRLSYWTSGDFVTGDVTGAGAINTSATTYVGWNEVHTVTPNSDGYFSLEVGSVSALPAMDSLSASTLQSLFLQVEVKAAADADTAYELLDRDTSSATIDRSPVYSVPFALNANMLDQRDVGSGSGSIPLLGAGGIFAKSMIPSALDHDIFTIDADDSSTQPTLRFGQTLAKTLSHYNGSFRFDDDLLIAGSLTVDQDSATGTGILVDSEATGAPALALDIQGSTASPHILFGENGTFDTTLFRSAANTLRMSGSFQIADTLSGGTLKADRALASSGTLSVAGAASLQSTVEVNGAMTLRSTLSGASTVTLSSLKNCSGIGTTVNGVLSCATTPVVIRKSADESVRSSTTLQDDDALTFAIGANETWAFSFYILGNGHTNPDFNFAVTAPAGSTCAYMVNGEETAQSSGHTTCGERSEKINGESATVPYFVHGTVVSGSTTGSVTLQWSQDGSSSNAVTVQAGSFLIAHRIQ